MKIVGLTGGIGSGKSTIARFFTDLGVPVYIADTEAKKLMHTDALKQAIIDLLGKDAYKENLLDRKWVAEQVFANEKLLKGLNAIVHPAVGKHFRDWANKQDSSYVIKEVAILFENGGEKECDLTILVIAPEKERVKRVMERDGVDEIAVKSRIKQQWNDEKKIPLADFIIENINLENSRKEVHEIHVKILRTLVNS